LERALTTATAAGPHLTQVTRLGLSNCFLVAEDDGLTLIDTSLWGSARAILRAAARLESPIRRVALTHAHVDHAGSLDALRRRLPEAEFAVGRRESELLAGRVAAAPSEPRGRLLRPLYQRSRLTPNRLLDPGDSLGSLTVVDAPGHTPGHLAFQDSRDGTLICGDAYSTLGGLFVTTEPVWRFPFLALAGTWDRQTALRTARRLRDLAPSRLATGHGPPLDAPQPAMNAALARAGGY